MQVVAILLILVLPILGHTADDLVKVPFLFTADQDVSQSDPAQNTPRSDTLRADSYLNAPMTRLEYLLTRMDSGLNEQVRIESVKDILQRRFDRWQAPPFSESIRGFALYLESLGRVLVGYQVENMGRPKIPMRESCQEILEEIARWLPHVPVGHALQNTLLGVLFQKDADAYTPMLRNLTAQFVHRVQISSVSEGGKVHHHFACQKSKGGGPVTYNKYSYRLN